MTPRKIRKMFKSRPTIEGAGVHLKRAFGYAQVPQFDPFLMLDDFHTSNPDEYLAGFPWHPHRGIETITYVLEGLVEHADSMGNRGIIGAGDVQWMTAGSGIIHQEMPQISPTGTMWGFQFWANLPASHKMMKPRYQDIKAADIPSVTLDNGVTVKVMAGELGGVKGPVGDIVIVPEMLDVTVPVDTTFIHQLPHRHTCFAYVLQGGGGFDATQELQYPETALLYEHDGDGIQVTALGSHLRFLLVSGKPLNEPVAWQGPIVMNTQEELRIAFDEYHRGVFVK
ncbi:MAG TPA: pirin family protein [Desulfuromonadales bacterium]|nr:pirin family protein [Desulfuromonadales bacterium]